VGPEAQPIHKAKRFRPPGKLGDCGGRVIQGRDGIAPPEEQQGVSPLAATQL
jgi:hypothetical protein